jgi:hypothetical protein
LEAVACKLFDDELGRKNILVLFVLVGELHGDADTSFSLFWLLDWETLDDEEEDDDRKLFKLLINLSGLLIIEVDSWLIWSVFWTSVELFKFNKLLFESTSMLALTALLNVSKDGKDVNDDDEEWNIFPSLNGDYFEAIHIWNWKFLSCLLLTLLL